MPIYLPLLRSFVLHVIELLSLYYLNWVTLVPFHYILCRTSLSISCMVNLVVINSQLCLSGNAFISTSLLKDRFAGYGILGWQFYILAFWMYNLTTFLPLEFLMRNLLIIYLRIPYMCWVISLVAFKIHTVSRKFLLQCVLVYSSLSLSLGMY